MSETDTLQSVIFENRPIRGELIHLSASFQAITKGRDYPANINRLLGEALASSVLISGIIKNPGRLTLQFQGQGNLRLLTASCTHEYHIRGLAQYDTMVDDKVLASALEKGQFAITFQPEKGKPYQGIVAIEDGSIALAAQTYFEQSEQLPSRFFLAVNDTQAAGLLLQTLPGNVDTENNWEHVTTLAQTITSEELLNLQNKTLLHRLFHEDDIRLFEKEPVSFRCTCSQTRSENALRLMDPAEIENLLQEKQVIDVCCEFCNTHYTFDHVDTERLLKTNINPPPGDQSH